jgi:hypothetical protein
MPDRNVAKNLQSCIVLCGECHEVCLRTVSHCLEKGGKHAARDHIRLLLDCAEICQTSANFMLRASDLHAVTCGACAEVCEQCAEDCRRLADDDAMRHCAEICERCAELCRLMAGELVPAEA